MLLSAIDQRDLELSRSLFGFYTLLTSPNVFFTNVGSAFNAR